MNGVPWDLFHFPESSEELATVRNISKLTISVDCHGLSWWSILVVRNHKSFQASDPSMMSILLGDAKVGSANWRSFRNIQS